MKNQNDMIISIVAIVLGLIGFSIGFFTKREVRQLASPEVTNLAPPQLQGADVKTATSLPGAGNSSAPMSTAGSGSRGFGGMGQSGPPAGFTPPTGPGRGGPTGPGGGAPSGPPQRPNKPTVTPKGG